MRKTHVLGLAATAFGMVLAACGGEDHAATPQPAPATTDFETFAQSLVIKSTCTTFIPADTNSVDFTFAADQDTAEPRDTTTFTVGCST